MDLVRYATLFVIATFVGVVTTGAVRFAIDYVSSPPCSAAASSPSPDETNVTMFSDSAVDSSSTDQPDVEANVEHADIFSPYAIQGFDDSSPRFDAARLWERLGINKGEIVGDESRSSFFRNCENCEADTD